MPYTEEEIKKYLDILHNYTSQPVKEVIRKSKCSNCTNTECFTIDSGYKICDECGVENGHVLGFYDIKDYDRLYYRKKSIYHRKYHYEKKVNQISKILNLTDEQKCELYDKLIKIVFKNIKFNLLSNYTQFQILYKYLKMLFVYNINIHLFPY